MASFSLIVATGIYVPKYNLFSVYNITYIYVFRAIDVGYSSGMLFLGEG